MKVSKEIINIQKKSNHKKSFLEILIDVFELTIRSSPIDVIKAQIKKTLDEDLKDYEDIPFISIKDPLVSIGKSIEETFEDSIMKELKYLLSHNQSDFALHTDRNNVIYILSRVLNSLINAYPNLIPQKEINHIYIIITSAIMGGRSEHLHTLISFLFQLCDFYPIQTLEVLRQTFYSVIEEERKEEIEKASLSIKYYLLALKSVFAENMNNDLLEQTDKYINLLKTMSIINKESVIQQCVDFYESKKHILPNDMITSYSYIFINGNSHKQIILLLRHYIQFTETAIQMYYQPVKTRYTQIINILKQKSFRENVYKIFSSKIVKEYYCISTQKENNPQLNVMTKKTIDSYEKFCRELSNEEFRNHFFDEHIYVMRLETSIKGFTNRYLQMSINYSGIDKIVYKKNDSTTSEKPIIITEEDKEILNIMKQSTIIVDDNREIMFIQVIIFI